MKKMSSIFGLLLMATSVAFAQDKTKPTAAPKPPVLTDTQKLVYFKATAEFQQAALQAQQAQTVATTKQSALQEAVKSVTDACGKGFAPSIDAKNDLVCVVAVPTK